MVGRAELPRGLVSYLGLKGGTGLSCSSLSRRYPPYLNPVRTLLVHPRVHGELLTNTWEKLEPYGSSPRTRGTPYVAADGVDVSRFIPAYTGNSPGSPTACRPGSVHPRVHGELLAPDCCRHRAAGSSPRTRGTRDWGMCIHMLLRFIPAYTGNSPAGVTSVCATSVHPRVHGELVNVNVAIVAVNGSSPRTRGTLKELRRISDSPRFIPAYTGNSATGRSSSGETSVHPRVHGEL